jgi:hypothetical protein
MQTYRLYFINAEGKITEPPKVVECQTDEEALVEAQKYLDGKAVEVWKGARILAHFDPIHPQK